MSQELYLFIGGSRDGQRLAVRDDRVRVQVPTMGWDTGVLIENEYYRAFSFQADRTVFKVYILDSMRPDEVVGRLIDRYRSCDCHRCMTEQARPAARLRMIVCETCGNKRCPRASDHRLGCTGSNEPGQAGSVYGEVNYSSAKKDAEQYSHESLRPPMQGQV